MHGHTRGVSRERPDFVRSAPERCWIDGDLIRLSQFPVGGIRPGLRGKPVPWLMDLAVLEEAMREVYGRSFALGDRARCSISPPMRSPMAIDSAPLRSPMPSRSPYLSSSRASATPASAISPGAPRIGAATRASTATLGSRPQASSANTTPTRHACRAVIPTAGSGQMVVTVRRNSDSTQMLLSMRTLGEERKSSERWLQSYARRAVILQLSCIWRPEDESRRNSQSSTPRRWTGLRSTCPS